MLKNEAFLSGMPTFVRPSWTFQQGKNWHESGTREPLSTISGRPSDSTSVENSTEIPLICKKRVSKISIF